MEGRLHADTGTPRHDRATGDRLGGTAAITAEALRRNSRWLRRVLIVDAWRMEVPRRVAATYNQDHLG
jgi:hypothetical protein